MGEMTIKNLVGPRSKKVFTYHTI